MDIQRLVRKRRKICVQARLPNTEARETGMNASERRVVKPSTGVSKTRSQQQVRSKPFRTLCYSYKKGSCLRDQKSDCCSPPKVTDAVGDLSAHFQKNSTCELCCVATTTRARCKHKPQKPADGIPPPTSCRDLITADHNNLFLDDESRNDH